MSGSALIFLSKYSVYCSGRIVLILTYSDIMLTKLPVHLAFVFLLNAPALDTLITKDDEEREEERLYDSSTQAFCKDVESLLLPKSTDSPYQSLTFYLQCTGKVYK